MPWQRSNREHWIMSYGPALFLSLTLGAYGIGVVLQRLGREHPLLNPTLLAIGIVVGVLVLFRIDYGTYLPAVQPIHVLLGPAVVALAVPLLRHLPLLRDRMCPLVIALLLGSLTAIASSIAAGWWFGLSRSVLLSLAPKSATTAVSMAIAAQIGGVPPVTAVLTVLAGISGAWIGGHVLKAMRIEDPAARGFAMGLASHGIATARAFQESETSGAFAGLAMALNAIATVLLAPLLVRLLMH
jgi:predicted murein hydrolase (TIGR00659 family)